MKQFIYKIQRQQLQVDEPLASLVLLDSGMALLGHFPLLVKRLGAVKAFKLGLKVLSGRGAYYAVIEDKQLLSDPYYVHEEEVPRAGATVTRKFQRTRWYNGRIYTWIGRQKRTGRGEGNSGLKFDQIESVE